MKNRKRILAWAGILVIAAAFIALIISTFTGASENVIMALLFCVIVIPTVLYAYQMILKVTKRKGSEENNDGEEKLGDKDK